MGDSFEIIVDTEATEKDAQELGERVQAWLLSRGVIGTEPDSWAGSVPGAAWRLACENPGEDSSYGPGGLEVIVGRTVFWTNDAELRCTVCQHVFNADDNHGKAIDSWWEGNEAAKTSCPACGHEELLTEWTGDFPYGFGNLGFTFWNWPKLSASFAQEIGTLLGHRIRRVWGKL